MSDKQDEKVVIDEDSVKKLLQVIDVGLCNGVGRPVPGHMCIEAAVCFAFGEGHSDNPTCVDQYLRNFKICLNDLEWPNKKQRAYALRRIGIAQLGTAGGDYFDAIAFAQQIYNRLNDLVIEITKRRLSRIKNNLGHVHPFVEILNPSKYSYPWIENQINGLRNARVDVLHWFGQLPNMYGKMGRRAPYELSDLMVLISKEWEIMEHPDQWTYLAELIEEVVWILKDTNTQGSRYLYLAGPFNQETFKEKGSPLFQ